ncbi:MAG: hypothetical protein K0V04_38670 [Deltaproteobacteria bacterium]|nr:hypothetical protein [Deltaproteobacteria bacterium]
MHIHLLSFVVLIWLPWMNPRLTSVHHDDRPHPLDTTIAPAQPSRTHPPRSRSHGPSRRVPMGAAANLTLKAGRL